MSTRQKRLFIVFVATLFLGASFYCIDPVSAASSIETWTGSVSFTLKLTTSQKDASGNRKLVTSNENFEGTMNLYWDTDPNVTSPTQGPEGCVLELMANDGTKICFNEFHSETGYATKSEKGTGVFVATGNISNFQGQGVPGIAYINGKSSFSLDSSGNLTSVSLGGALGGGYSDDLSGIISATVPSARLASSSSPFEGSFNGNWSGTCSNGFSESGNFQVDISSNGSVTGTYSGSESGTITGTVTTSGNYSASGGGSGTVSWNGSLSLNGTTINGSGSWSEAVHGCSGTWFGTGTT